MNEDFNFEWLWVTAESEEDLMAENFNQILSPKNKLKFLSLNSFFAGRQIE